MINTKNKHKQQLLELVHAPIRWYLLESALTLNLFDYIQQWQTVKEVAATLVLDKQACGIWLDGLTSLGFIEKSSKGYRVASLYSELLLSSSDNSMVTLLTHLANLRHCDVDALIDTLKIQKIPSQKGKFFDAGHWSNIVNKLRAYHRCGASNFALNQLSDLDVWGNAEKIMDLGAGSEQLAVDIINSHSSIDVTIVDLPGCAEQIKSALTVEQHQRITVLAGDYNHLILPDKYNIVWASMSLYYAKNFSKLIHNIKNSLVKGGCFISCHEGLTHQRTQPEKHVVGRLIPSITGNNVSFNQRYIANAMLDNGFKQVISRTIETNFGPMDIDIGYV